MLDVKRQSHLVSSSPSLDSALTDDYVSTVSNLVCSISRVTLKMSKSTSQCSIKRVKEYRVISFHSNSLCPTFAKSALVTKGPSKIDDKGKEKTGKASRVELILCPSFLFSLGETQTSDPQIDRSLSRPQEERS